MRCMHAEHGNSTYYSKAKYFASPMYLRLVSSTPWAGTDGKRPVKLPMLKDIPTKQFSTPMPLPSMKQNIAERVHIQGSKQSSEVTILSGINLREEDKQLFVDLEGARRSSKAVSCSVEGEGRRLVLQKYPL
ncbi:hypothetical protein RJ641_013554 [Dillenia turbinata]|uniref:Uncharacterized protein n=1 Tax=Dillenia turbinata TaxID=194707 RepID=A0AAN8W4M7_9MAGN